MEKFEIKRLVIKKAVIIGFIIIVGIIFGVINNYAQAIVTPANIDSSMQVMSGNLRTTDAMAQHGYTGGIIAAGRTISMTVLCILAFILCLDTAIDIYKFVKARKKQSSIP